MICLGYNGFSNAADLFATHFGRSGRDRYRVLGHDAGAAIVVDGEVLGAVEEERLNRIKKTSAFPKQSIEWCLEIAGLELDDIDLFAFPWSFDVANETGSPRSFAPVGLSADTNLYDSLVSRQAILTDFKQSMNYELASDRLVLVSHHDAHLTCGRHLAGTETAAFLVTDGRGEVLSSVMGEVGPDGIRHFRGADIPIEHSLGLLYSKITRYLGFVPNNDEYKVMGLSAFASTIENNPLMDQLIRLKDGGSYELEHALNRFSDHEYHLIFDEIFAEFSNLSADDYRASVAWCAQNVVEVVTAHQVVALRRMSHASTLLVEGGVALNCVNNSKLLNRGEFDNVEVSFAASDVGVAMGAAVAVSKEATSHRRSSSVTPYMGPSISRDDALKAIEKFDDLLSWKELLPDDLISTVADLLTGDVVVAWSRGRLELGPRALGNRSILANPSIPGMKDTLNIRIKHREPFRPFAPVVLESRAQEIFDMGKKKCSPYMTFTFPVRSEYLSKVGAACHIDGTARVQTVTPESNPSLAALLKQFEEYSGVPCLVNTSFNDSGEPIVSTALDAVNCFLSTGIDYLVLDNFLVSRRVTS